MGAYETSPIADALFPKVRQRLLAALYLEPERSFYVNELMRLTNSGVGALQRELEGLTAAGLVTMRRQGNQKHYQANAESPIFAELNGIAVKTSGIRELARQALAPLADKVVWACLYGSVAKGNMHAGSDIDLLLVARDLTLESVFAALAATEERLKRKINPTLYTAKDFLRRKQRGNPFLAKVLAGPTVTLLGTQDAIA